ncbi:MAG: hypothetical protein QM723_03555 [Myxococcaceae bacterium]
MSDARTLRLAYPEISVEELDVYASAVTPDGYLDRSKLEAGGMKLEKAHRIGIAVAAFLRPRRAQQRLAARLDQARLAVETAIAEHEAPPKKDSELAEMIPQRLRELNGDKAFSELYSDSTLSALKQREAQLLQLPRPV